ncbi:hypothetical protein [Burkholderia contaminans]|uniref:hypothetical protein n=1 Tax=Burkholderia contaminans TaxID=488447 RepID=UPI001CF0FF3C|nr:hypothetical protein [Burkholderia contaminans]MCA8100989.1 hypothetical protein [Burkholderia contaminans]
MKSFQQAKWLALHFNMQIETSRMSKPKITDFVLRPSDLDKNHINLKEGIIEATHAEDHTRATDAIEKVGMFKEAVIVAAGKFETQSLLLPEVVKQYLLEKKSGNKSRTLYEKENCYNEFIELFDKPKVGAVTDETAIIYKQQTWSRAHQPNGSIPKFHSRMIALLHSCHKLSTTHAISHTHP